MVVTLPADVLLLLCEELGHRQDFKTLLNCAVAGKALVGPALLWLYRVHDQTEYFRNDEAEADLPGAGRGTWEEGVALRRSYTCKWALLWKSIIRSSLGNTAYPYSLYIRSLDLRNLETLLDDPVFREFALTDFFANDMAKFLTAQDTPVKKKTRNAKIPQIRLSLAPIVEVVGESITRYLSEAAVRDKTTVALEEIAGNLSSIAIPRFASGLLRLRSMTLYDGAVLNASVAAAISTQCPSFDDLTFCFCSKQDVDPDFASFFSGLRTNSLQSFTALSAHSIGPETLLALNNHSNSLKALKLNGLKSAAVKNLSLLQGCGVLEILDIQDSDGFVNLEETENDIFLEVVEWLGRCDRLRDLSFKNFLSAPSILTDICFRDNIRLRKLEVVDQYSLASNQTFHQAIAQQKSLETLILRGDPEGSFRDDIDTVISAISQLSGLKELDLLNTSEYFKSAEIRQIASSLRGLEKLTIAGFDVTDEIWPSMAGLHHLRALNSHGLSSFSCDGLLNFISTLRPSNHGLVLSVWNQSGDFDLTDIERTTIQESIMEKVDGRFEFVLYRDNESDFDSSD